MRSLLVGELGFHFPGNEQALDAGRAPGPVHLAHDAVGPRLEAVDVLERGNIEGQEELPVDARHRPVDHVAGLEAVRRARQQAGQHAGDHCQADPLEVADRSDQPEQSRRRVGRRQAIGIEGPIGWQRVAGLVIHADLAMSGRAECDVQNHRSLVSTRKRNGDGIDADDLVGAAPRCHRRQRIGRGDADHVVRQSHHRVAVHRAAMVAAAQSSDTDTVFDGPTDRLLHRERRADLSHAVAPVDDDRRPPPADDVGSSARIHAPHRELGDVVGNPQHAVGVDAAQVGLHQRVGQQSRIRFAHTAGGEDARHQRAQFVRRHAAIGSGTGIERHGLEAQIQRSAWTCWY